MARKQYFKGIDSEELVNMDTNRVLSLIPSRSRRVIKSGLNDSQKRLMAKVKLAREGKYQKEIRTHCRATVIVPEMLTLIIQVHNGKEFVPVHITHEMIGQRLGEFAMTRKSLKHSAPGIGATKSTSSVSVK